MVVGENLEMFKIEKNKVFFIRKECKKKEQSFILRSETLPMFYKSKKG